jgi:hypothetical protein
VQSFREFAVWVDLEGKGFVHGQDLHKRQQHVDDVLTVYTLGKNGNPGPN